MQEFDFVKIGAARPRRLLNCLSMVVLKRLEMGSMRWETKRDDTILITVVDKLFCAVRAIAIKEQEAVYSSFPSKCEPLKMRKPFRTKVIVRVAGF